MIVFYEYSVIYFLSFKYETKLKKKLEKRLAYFFFYFGKNNLICDFTYSVKFWAACVTSIA